MNALFVSRRLKQIMLAISTIEMSRAISIHMKLCNIRLKLYADNRNVRMTDIGFRFVACKDVSNKKCRTNERYKVGAPDC